MYTKVPPRCQLFDALPVAERCVLHKLYGRICEK